jgi:hypothetical protein
VNEIYETFESDINTIFDKHVPTKEMHRKNNQLPYMNRELRKTIYNTKMYYSKFLKDKRSKNWEQYRIRRNLVNKLKQKSENNYFQERCTGGCKQTEFWRTMKPFFSKKSCGTQSRIILQDNDKIVTKNVDVAEVFNKFFINVAQDIGKDYIFNKNDHPSLQKIEDKNFVKNSFEFKSTNEKSLINLMLKKQQVLITSLSN